MIKPDGYLPDGAPVYLAVGRRNGKSMLQLEIYRRLLNIPDDVWEEIKRKFEGDYYGHQDEDSQD